jgi:hypothetical protein
MSGHYHHGYHHHGEGYCGCGPYSRSHHHDRGCHGSGGHHHQGGCSSGDAFMLKRRYLSPEEKKEKLAKYIDALKKELVGAEAALENL